MSHWLYQESERMKEVVGNMSTPKMKWLDVKTIKPKFSRSSDALGTPVLIWPRNPERQQHYGLEGFAYYGCRATGTPAFYLYGATIEGVTHWMTMPEGPDDAEEYDSDEEVECG